MKKLFLFLSITCNILTMMAQEPIEENPRELVSRKAARLHHFLTENLDNPDQNPNDRMVDDLADELNKLSLNPAVLLELKDKRTDASYDFGNYLSRKGNEKKHLGILLVRKDFIPREACVSQTSPDKKLRKVSDWETVGTITIYETNDSDFVVPDRVVNKVALVHNGEDTRQTASNEYSLLHLLVACKRPAVICKLLDRSRYMFLIPTAPLLKKQCRENSTGDDDNDDWKAATRTVDDAEKLSAAMDMVVKVKDAALHNVPMAAMFALRKDALKKDLEELNRDGSISFVDALLQSLYISNKPYYTSGATIYRLIEWPGNIIHKGRMDDTRNDMFGIMPSWNWNNTTCRLVNYTGHIGTFAVTRFFQNAIWIPFIDRVDDWLDTDRRIASTLSRKPIANAMIGTSKACQAVTPEIVKARLRNKAESEKSEANSND